MTDPVVPENHIVRCHRFDIQIAPRYGDPEYADVVDSGVFHQGIRTFQMNRVPPVHMKVGIADNGADVASGKTDQKIVENSFFAYGRKIEKRIVVSQTVFVQILLGSDSGGERLGEGRRVVLFGDAERFRLDFPCDGGQNRGSPPPADSPPVQLSPLPSACGG